MRVSTLKICNTSYEKGCSFVKFSRAIKIKSWIYKYIYIEACRQSYRDTHNRIRTCFRWKLLSNDTKRENWRQIEGSVRSCQPFPITACIPPIQYTANQLWFTFYYKNLIIVISQHKTSSLTLSFDIMVSYQLQETNGSLFFKYFFPFSKPSSYN